MSNMKIAPSILSMDFSKFDEQINILNNNVEYIHFDVMDGKFVPNTTFNSDDLIRFRKSSNLILDVHLMIENPYDFIGEYANAGANIITFHFEAANNDISLCKKIIDKIHSYNIKAGISIKPHTDISLIKDLFPILDLVLVMSVEPGFGGQKFIESSLNKVKYLKEFKIKNNYKYIIEIDGGINDQTGKLAKDAGVELAVAGSFIFKGDIENNINKLKKL